MAAKTDFPPTRIWAPTVAEGGVFLERPDTLYVQFKTDQIAREVFPWAKFQDVAVVHQTSFKCRLALTPREISGGVPKNTLATIMGALRKHYGPETMDRLLQEEYKRQMGD